MGNVFNEDTDEEPPSEYKNLQNEISFDGFHYTERWRDEELTILTPRLEDKGYTDVVFHDGEKDSFGPLTRICSARKDGIQHWFIYG